MTKLSDLQRIKIVMAYLNKRGGNKESVNNVYRKLIFAKHNIIVNDYGRNR